MIGTRSSQIRIGATGEVRHGMAVIVTPVHLYKLSIVAGICPQSNRIPALLLTHRRNSTTIKLPSDRTGSALGQRVHGVMEAVAAVGGAGGAASQVEVVAGNAGGAGLVVQVAAGVAGRVAGGAACPIGPVEGGLVAEGAQGVVEVALLADWVSTHVALAIFWVVEPGAYLAALAVVVPDVAVYTVIIGAGYTLPVVAVYKLGPEVGLALITVSSVKAVYALWVRAIAGSALISTPHVHESIP